MLPATDPAKVPRSRHLPDAPLLFPVDRFGVSLGLSNSVNILNLKVFRQIKRWLPVLHLQIALLTGLDFLIGQPCHL